MHIYDMTQIILAVVSMVRLLKRWKAFFKTISLTQDDMQVTF